MAYLGGTQLKSCRLLDWQLAWLDGHTDNRNKTINEALSAYLRREQHEELTYSEFREINSQRMSLNSQHRTKRRKVMLRLMRQHADYIMMNKFNLTRCIDYALTSYINERKQNDSLPTNI